MRATNNNFKFSFKLQNFTYISSFTVEWAIIHAVYAYAVDIAIAEEAFPNWQTDEELMLDTIRIGYRNRSIENIVPPGV